MGRMLVAMGELFGRMGWPFEPVGPNRWSLRYEGSEATYDCQAAAIDDDDDSLFLFETICPLDVPADRQAAVLDLCNRINWRSVIGTFALDDKEIRLRSSLIVNRWTALDSANIAPIVLYSVDMMDTYLPAIASVIAGDASVEAAFALATG